MNTGQTSLPLHCLRGEMASSAHSRSFDYGKKEEEENKDVHVLITCTYTVPQSASRIFRTRFPTMAGHRSPPQKGENPHRQVEGGEHILANGD